MSRRSKGRILLPLALEQQYERELEQVGVFIANRVAEFVIPSLSSYGVHTPINDAIRANLSGKISAFGSATGLASRIIKSMSAENVAQLLDRTIKAHGQRISEFQKRQLTKLLSKDVETQPWIARMAAPQVNDLIETWVSQNAALIKSIPDYYTASVENLILKGIPEGMTTKELAKKIEEHGHVSVNKAKLIARDQTTKLYGRLNQARQQALGVTHYTWDGVGDERERETHRILNGKTFSWDNPPITNDEGETNHPGEDIQCRCTAGPVLDNLGI